MDKIYLYLSKRDKSSIKVVSVLAGNLVSATRLGSDELGKLNLPIEWQKDIENIIKENRFYWEPWLESASNYEDLKKKLRKRGYKNLPISSYPIYEKTTYKNHHRITTKNLPQHKTMVQKTNMTF